MAQGELSGAVRLSKASRRVRELRVLVVHDNRHMRQLLRTLLVGYGVKDVFEAADCPRAIDRVGDVRPDLVITDYDIKPVTGVAFVKMLRRLCPPPFCSVPVILITDHTDMRHIESARDAGITEALCKPVTVKSLYDRIVEIIERPRAFVRATGFVGPDRRRRRSDRGYEGPKRRSEDNGITIEYLPE
jgi:CheY-like chemotaxis protein